MLTVLILSLLAVTVLPIAGIALICFVTSALVWAVLFPIRLLFKLLFGLVGLALAVVLVPVLMVIVGIVVAVALVAAAFAALAPLLPVAAVVLIGWAIYKAVTRRSIPAI